MIDDDPAMLDHYAFEIRYERGGTISPDSNRALFSALREAAKRVFVPLYRVSRDYSLRIGLTRLSRGRS